MSNKWNDPLNPDEISFDEHEGMISAYDWDGCRIMRLPIHSQALYILTNEEVQKQVVAAYNQGYQQGKTRGANELRLSIRTVLGIDPTKENGQ